MNASLYINWSFIDDPTTLQHDTAALVGCLAVRVRVSVGGSRK